MAFQDDGDATVRDSASLQVMAQKAKFQGIQSFVLKNSFSRALPEAFGKHKTGVTNRVALPAFTTYKAFDTQQADSSWKSQFLDQVKGKAESLRNQAREELQGEAKSMAIECITASALFIRELFTWITAEFGSMGHEEESADTSVPDWDFLSKSVKAIFLELQLVRAGGQLKAVGPGHEAWACIRTMKLQEELRKDFSRHKIVVNVLYGRIQKDVALKSMFNKHATAIIKRMGVCKKLAQQAMTKAAK